MEFDKIKLLVADLSDVITSKNAVRKQGDLTALPEPEKTLATKRVTRKAKLEALKKESELALRDQIRRLLALPPDRRTNFLRRRVGFRMSCL